MVLNLKIDLKVAEKFQYKDDGNLFRMNIFKQVMAILKKIILFLEQSFSYISFIQLMTLYGSGYPLKFCLKWVNGRKKGI